jgi:DSF synthase
MHAIINLADCHTDVVLRTEALTVRHDLETRSLWLNMHAAPRPCFTEVLLKDIHSVHRRIISGELDVDFYVEASHVPNVFNLGGDLSLFRHCALTQDWERLMNYATLCIDILHEISAGFGRQVISLSLIQGDALGGGFEAALATDFMIAEQHTRLGFPEVLFNLFPGMGAYTFLSRKIGPQPAQRLILSGEMRAASELKELGVLDDVVPSGGGLQAAENFIRETRRHLRGHKSFLQARRRATFWPGREELIGIVHDWVESVKQISERDLKLMDKLVGAQNRLKPLAA